MTTQDINTNQSGIPPKNWLVESILVTIFCCQILGIISIVYAASVESKFYRGDLAGAESASRTAKTLVLVSAAFGVITVITLSILFSMGVFGAIYKR